MAQVQEKPDSKTEGRKRTKEMAIQLDMTPMVDLAFLLLTFFMLTTSFSKAQALKLHTPQKAGNETPVKPENALTILLAEDDKIYYYFGLNDTVEKPKLEETDYSDDGIRNVLKSPAVAGNRKMVVMIKPMLKSRYKNVVDMLDELKIAETKKYALVKVTDQDRQLLDQNQKGN